jgi:tetratricopeptide (TPR) repeat protein
VRMTVSEREAYTRGRRSFERGDEDAALDAFRILLSSKPDFADVHYMVGVLLDRRGDQDAAIESLRAAISLNPSYAEALLALASVHERGGDFDRSCDFAERAASVSPPHISGIDATTRGKLANLQAAVADAYAEVGEYREAIEAYRKALDRCPDYHDIRYRLGVALRQGGLPHKAEQEFKRVLRGNSKLLDANLQLGLTYYSQGRTTDAVAQWQHVLEQDHEREEARMYIRLAEKGEGPGTR